jgi:hypothetical protein
VSVLLARRRAETNTGPSGQVLIVTGDGLNRERPNIAEGLSDGGIDGPDSFLDDPEENDGLRLSETVMFIRSGYSRYWDRHQGC